MLARFDTALLRLMRTRGHSPALERAALRLGRAAEWGALWSAGAAGAAVLDEGRREQWIAIALLTPLSVLVNYAVKLVVRRRRPEIDGLPPLSKVQSKLSFPSAHSVSSFAAATAIARVEPAAAAPALGLAALIAAGRPYLGVHYPSDVLAGAALGAAIGATAPLEAIG